MKAFWKSKTLWMNVATGAVLVGRYAGIPIPAPDPLTTGLANVIGNVVLRFLTRQPIGLMDSP